MKRKQMGRTLEEQSKLDQERMQQFLRYGKVEYPKNHVYQESRARRIWGWIVIAFFVGMFSFAIIGSIYFNIIDPRPTSTFWEPRFRDGF